MKREGELIQILLDYKASRVDVNTTLRLIKEIFKRVRREKTV